MRYEDQDGKQLTNGDIIDIDQSVNGQSEFIVLNTNPLDIRYRFDINYKYEYDESELLIGMYDEPGFTIIGNVNKNN